ncbi:MAG: tadA [Alphaproteobacteria bacterium]|jgi:tRNA(adenine34) deaminase|nr:tadA [Alphaproteobacteria bacterium]
MVSKWMALALAQAREAADRGETPVGAVLVYDGKVIAAAGNRVEELSDPTAHAEILVVREAARLLQTPRLVGADLYVTLEPCPMCATALSFARIKRVFFGAFDPKGGGIDHGPRIFGQPTCHHQPEVFGGISEQACAALLVDFFKARRT